MVTPETLTHQFVEFRREEIEQAIASRFEQQASRHPERLAVKAGDHCLSYDELNQASNRLAHAILAKSEDQDKPVALLFEPGHRMIIAILAAHKAGKFWVPLDPRHPHERRAFIVNDTAPVLILTDQKNFALAQEVSAGRCPVIDVEKETSSMSPENPGLAIRPERLAYVLYTSGSTGQPKGVIHNQRNVLHSIRSHTNSLKITPEDRVALLSSYSHIAGATAIFRALLNGASVLTFDLKRESFSNLAEWLGREEITVYHSVPSVFRNFVETLNGEVEEFPRLRLIHLGGEPMIKRDVELYKKHFSPNCVLLNNLGATEVSTFRQFFINKSTPIDSPVVPVGYPVDDKEILLLDDRGNLVSDGQPGEIAVRSSYLALGYWRRPELTQQAFGGDADTNGLGTRIYRTGDLGRMMPDGCLVHLGRKDFQIKIRGHRIEPAEITSALLEHDEVQQAFVTAREIEKGQLQLVAYVVPRSGTHPTLRILRQFLEKRIPDFMVPSLFVFLPALPLTPTGKVDFKALPAPEVSRPDLESPYEPPHDEVERGLAALWSEVLGLPDVGIHDNFFEIGGHSLTAVRLVARIQKVFHQNLSLAVVFEAPTVQKLAEILRGKKHLHASRIEPVRRIPRPVSDSKFLKPDSTTRGEGR